MRRKNYLKYKKLEQSFILHNTLREAKNFQRIFKLSETFDPLKTNVKQRVIVYKLSSEKKPVPLPVKRINDWQLNPLYIAIVKERQEKKRLAKLAILEERKTHNKFKNGLNCKQRRNMDKYGYSSYVKYRISLK